MKKTTFILAPLILLLFYGCATTSTSITANKADWYNQRLKRVYISLNTTKVVEPFSERLATGILSRFRQNLVEGEYSIQYIPTLIPKEKYTKRNPFSLDTETELLEKINDYQPKQIMVIQLTSTSYNTDFYETYFTGANFEITIIDFETEKIVWEGTLDVLRQYRYHTTIEPTLDILFEKLIQDGLFKMK